MKDSQIGSYGVLALVLSLVLRWQAVLWLIEADWLMALPAVEALSRALMVWVMQALPNARQRGLSAQTGVPGRRTALLAGGIGALMALLLGLTLAALIVGIAAMLLAMVVARNKIGGQTGDVLGAVQQVTAVAVLVTLAAQA
jgi:adenosylcobinamide-GDP ribazoletransferase